MLLVLCSVVSCGGDLTWPEPAAPIKPRREHEERVKPEKNVQLRGVGFQFGNDTMRVRNEEKFSLTLLDDIVLTLSAPNAEYVRLRCRTPRSLPSGTEIEISYNLCSITTNEPGPHARVTGFRLVAREGHRETNIEGGPEILGKPK
jgi:hypothetical protein